MDLGARPLARVLTLASGLMCSVYTFHLVLVLVSGDRTSSTNCTQLRRRWKQNQVSEMLHFKQERTLNDVQKHINSTKLHEVMPCKATRLKKKDRICSFTHSVVQAPLL
jgi:hypothetical protein